MRLSVLGHQQRSDNVPAWSGQPHKADLSKNSPSMLLSATNEALARLRVSDLTAAAPCGPSLFEHTGFLQAGRSRPRYESGATGIGKLENGSRPEAISEIARLRRSLPEPDPENRAAISIRSARPPIITVMSGLAAPDHHPSPSLAAEVIVGGWRFPLDLPARAPRLKWLHQRPAGGARDSTFLISSSASRTFSTL